MTDYNDYDDNYERELRWQERKREIKELEDDANRYQYEKNQEAAQAEQNRIFKEALDEQGLTIEQFHELKNLDPEFYNRAYSEGLKNLVRTVKTRARDPRTGQFIKQSQTPANQPDPHAAHFRGAADRLESLKQTAQKRQLTDSETEEALDHIIGNLYNS